MTIGILWIVLFLLFIFAMVASIIYFWVTKNAETRQKWQLWWMSLAIYIILSAICVFAVRQPDRFKQDVLNETTVFCDEINTAKAYYYHKYTQQEHEKQNDAHFSLNDDGGMVYHWKRKI